ncbi:periplasmic nitrate reductase chaperone NapD [Candidatus Thermokryptus mobilis]|uniref:Periplasmic nitrate reductase chaperone NapD n=1 Tax=Candidatus Thermokryptus mobilis TaxID=1643428 RepID=A0A0S4N0V8_9BACT|nr:chaperone NapD [Candidatus Thermokryptus mobilis]CUU04729.1 periplasmic nitrate reductase chaperone NapD [Candidatus Thermokryptus mobilis]
MIIASGYIVAENVEKISSITNALIERGIEVPEIKDEKLIFLIERNTEEEITKEINGLRYVDGVVSVQISYISLPGADEGSDIEI